MKNDYTMIILVNFYNYSVGLSARTLREKYETDPNGLTHNRNSLNQAFGMHSL